MPSMMTKTSITAKPTNRKRKFSNVRPPDQRALDPERSVQTIATSLVSRLQEKLRGFVNDLILRLATSV